MCRPRIPQRDVERLAPAPVAAADRRRRRTRSCRRRQEVGAVRDRAGTSSPGCSRTRAARPRSPRRRSTATSATARTRSRPTASIWGRDNRGAMLRVIGGRATRRRGSRTASASRRRIRISTSPRRSISGLDGIARAARSRARRPTRRTKRQRRALPRDARRSAGGAARGRVPARRPGQRVRGLLLPHQGGRDRALQPRSERVGAAGVLRPVLAGRPGERGGPR